MDKRPIRVGALLGDPHFRSRVDACHLASVEVTEAKGQGQAGSSACRGADAEADVEAVVSLILRYGDAVLGGHDSE